MARLLTDAHPAHGVYGAALAVMGVCVGAFGIANRLGGGAGRGRGPGHRIRAMKVVRAAAFVGALACSLAAALALIWAA